MGNARRRRQLGTSPTERPASGYSPPSASGRSPKSGRRRRPTFWRELPILVVVALVLTFLIQTFLAKVYVSPDTTFPAPPRPGFVIRYRVDRIGGVGPWVASDS